MDTQRDLCKLRLNTARSYVKMISDGQGPVSFSSGVSLRLNARVQGIGPRFQIKIDLQNTGSKVRIILRYMEMVDFVVTGRQRLVTSANHRHLTRPLVIRPVSPSLFLVPVFPCSRVPVLRPPMFEHQRPCDRITHTVAQHC